MEISSVQVMNEQVGLQVKTTEQDGPMFSQILEKLSKDQGLSTMADNSSSVSEEADKEEDTLAFNLIDLSWMLINNNEDMNMDQVSKAIESETNSITSIEGSLDILDTSLADNIGIGSSENVLYEYNPVLEGDPDWSETLLDVATAKGLKENDQIKIDISKTNEAMQDITKQEMTTIDKSKSDLPKLETDKTDSFSNNRTSQDTIRSLDRNLTSKASNNTNYQGLNRVDNEVIDKEFESILIDKLPQDNKTNFEEQEGLRKSDDNDMKYFDADNSVLESERIQTNNLNIDNVISREINFDDNIHLVNDALDEMLDLDITSEGNSIRVKLSPEDLGYIDLSLKMEDGKLLAKILVESEQVRDLFNLHIDKLNDKLISQNINVERLDVDLNFDTYNQATYSQAKHSQSNSNNNHDPRKNSLNNHSRTLTLDNTQEITSKGNHIISSKGLNILV